MTLDRILRQKPGKPARSRRVMKHCRRAMTRKPWGERHLLQQVLSRENMVEEWKRVKTNKGSAGADGVTIGQTVEHLLAEPYTYSRLL